METMDTRNVQTVAIERLNEKIAEDRQMLRLQDDSINKLLRICRGKDATIDENRELKETIRELDTDICIKDRRISQHDSDIDELKQDRDWWRTSALGTEKERAHLDIELIECHDTIDEKTATIDKLKGGAWMLHNEDDRIDALQYGSVTGLFNRVKELEAKLVGKDVTIDVQRAAIHVMSGGHGKKIIADNEMLKDGIAAAAKDSVKAMKLIRDRGDKIKELEAKLDRYARLIKDISVNCKEHNAYLKSKLEAEEDKNRQLRYKIAYNPCRGLQEEIWELKDAIVEKNDEIKELRKERDEYKESIKLERIEHNTERKATTQFQNDKIKELKSKLIDRERQFNELDGVLDRTSKSLHVATDYIRAQNDEITKKDDWISSYSKNDKRLNRLLDELRVDVQTRDKAIDELMRRTR